MQKVLMIFGALLVGEAVHGLTRLRDADLPLPADLNALAKTCANSTVKNPDKKKTTQGPSSCVFDKLGCLPGERTKVDWDKFKTKFMNRDDIVRLCKDSDYDTDGGFWDNVGDWIFGENFDYASLEKALTNFFKCCKDKLMKECEDKFVKKYPKQP